MGQKAAIVTTLRNPGRALESFIKYHLSSGFDHIFLFFDHPDDSPVPWEAQLDPKVTFILCDATMQEKWRRSKLYRIDEVRQYIDSEVIARQMLNVEIAVGLALEKRMDWLLHIDVDELFYTPNQSVQDHFQSLAGTGVQGVIYLNYEAVPEKVVIEDYFREVTLFKKPQWTFAGKCPTEKQREISLSEKQRELVKDIPQFPRGFFHFYGNGKSAARLNPELLPAGVHRFRLAVGALTRTIEKGGPTILHYPCCGFDSFWQKHTLRKFPDKWLGKYEIPRIYLEAQDVVSRGDKKAAGEFYEKHFVLSDLAAINALIENGLLCRILEPSNVLATSH
jgi:hypothetical protein